MAGALCNNLGYTRQRGEAEGTSPDAKCRFLINPEGKAPDEPGEGSNRKRVGWSSPRPQASTLPIGRRSYVVLSRGVVVPFTRPRFKSNSVVSAHELCGSLR